MADPMHDSTMRSRLDVRGENHPDGSRRLRVPMVDGHPHGKVREWWNNGKLRFEATYVHGKRHGMLRFWYPSGALESMRRYVDGEKHGRFTDWFESGRVAAEGRYAHDELVELREWDEVGRPVRDD